MLGRIENLKLVSSYQGETRENVKTEGRKYHAFLFRTKGEGVYITEGKQIRIREGEMSFLPQGSSYEFRKVSEDKCEHMSISFIADIPDGEITVFSMNDFNEKNYILSHFTRLWKFGNESDKYKCYSLFYAILSYVSNIENTAYSAKKKFMVIEPAIEYLKDHIFDTALKTDELHLLCGVSDTYFRKLFVSKFGTTPIEYITSKRLGYAKELLDNDNFIGVADVARMVGYSDPLYFSRVFKKKYGVPPSKA